MNIITNYFIRVLKAALFLFGFIPFSLLANVSITAPSLTVSGCGAFPTNAGVLGNIVITENLTSDFNGGGTLILQAPANFEFLSAGTVSYNAGDLTSATVSLTSSTTITLTWARAAGGNGLKDLDILTWAGVVVRGINLASGPSNVIRQGGTSVIAGDVNGTVHATLTSNAGTSPLAPNAPDVYRCGTGSVTLNANGGAYPNYFWYSESVGGTLLANAASYTTPSLSSTTPYYVSDGVLSNEFSLSTGAVAVTCTTAVVNSAQLFNITNTQSNAVVITRLAFSVNYAGACPAQIFYRTGTYVGNETTTSGWIQVYNATFTRAAPNPQVLDVADFVIPAGATYGIYIYLQGDPSAFASGAGTYSDANITITGGAMECQISAPFTLGSGSLYANYTVSGAAYYKAIYCESARTECEAQINSATTPSVTISPNTGTIICAGTNVTFTAVPTNGGATPSYQWYVGAVPVGVGPTYSTSTLVNGNVVSCVLTPSGEMCPSPATATSNAVTMSVLAPTTINSNPGNTVLCQNGNTSFTCASTPAGPYQWQVSTDNGISWTSITAAGTVPTYAGWTTGTLNLTGVDDPNNGYQYRCLAGCTPSNVAVLTINPVSDPAATNNGSCSSPASIALTATGAGAGEDYKWYDAVTGGTLLQTGGATFTTPPIGVTTTYYVTKYNTVPPFCESYPRTPVIAEIYTAPVIVSNPSNVTVSAGSSSSFSVTANGTNLSYQWQVNTGSGWNNIVAAGTNPTYDNWTSQTLLLYGIALANNGYLYRCVVSGICSFTTTSNQALLTVNALPNIYLHPTVGLQSTYIGACMQPTCNGTYYDDGGAAGNYSNNVNNIFRTFCPNTPLKAVRATVSNLNVEYTGLNCNDVLYVQNGPGQGSPILWAGCGTSPATIRTSAGAYGAGVFTSTHMSGCLTFRFSSNATNAWSGWQINLDCIDFAGGPTGETNTDCSNATPICSDVSASSFTYGPGLTSDACTGCVTSEYFTEWYRIRMATGGTIQMEIVPNGVSDLDFALFQASNCGTLGVPVRCSYAARTAPGKTGMRDAPGTLDFSEDVSGDQWVQEINVSAGDNFYLMVNEWDKPNPNQYTIDWTLTNGASFDCTIVLPVSMIDLYAERVNDNVEVTWVTASETNNDFFTVERSVDGIEFKEIGRVDGAGNSNHVLTYTFVDDQPYYGLAYYRIKQTDFDGAFTHSDIVAVNYLDEDGPALEVNLYPNPAENYITVQANHFFVEKPYEVYNVIGDRVSKGTLNGVSQRILLDDFSNGLYLLKIQGVDVQRFMVVRN